MGQGQPSRTPLAVYLAAFSDNLHVHVITWKNSENRSAHREACEGAKLPDGQLGEADESAVTYHSGAQQRSQQRVLANRQGIQGLRQGSTSCKAELQSFKGTQT